MEQSNYIQMKSQAFEIAEAITILSFFNYFELIWHTNRVHTVAAMWLFHLFKKKTASTVLKAHTCLQPKKKRHQVEVTLTTYCEVVNYFLSPHATDDVLAESNAKRTHPCSHQR